MASTREHHTIAPIVGPQDPGRFTDSGIEIQPLYTEEDLLGGLRTRLDEPGEYPYTRGVHRDMYRKQLWTMRQYAGYASAKESNERYRYLLVLTHIHFDHAGAAGELVARWPNLQI
jgi:methylmalonyl-CoA mutase N-terminal domain/subunit